MSKGFISFVLAALICGPSRLLLAQLLIDSAKPYVYMTLDHAGRKELWVRLVNNSTIPIRIRSYSKGGDGAGIGINYTVVLTTEGKLKYASARSAVPSGHTQDVSSSESIRSGVSLLFTIPATDVSEYWYIDTAFRFDLPRKMRGNDPTLHVTLSRQEMR